MPDVVNRQTIAIKCIELGKSYILYPSPKAMAFDRLGIYSLFPSKRYAFPKHRALSGVNIEIKKGERVAFLGRNGAGKSTLLKILTGISQPTEGRIEVNGSIQALFDLGTGFHPEFSGRDNIHAALAYNGLPRDREKAAIEDIIEFCALGEYLDQPVSTYSSGMRARLFFAVATAIVPDVLICDEVLSVGDAYFSARSAERVRRMTANGCTLLLVSHSMEQVLQFCDRAIWLHEGRVRADGPALEVAKDYEAYIRELQHGDSTRLASMSTERSEWVRKELLEKTAGDNLRAAGGSVKRWVADGRLLIQEVHAISEDGGAIRSGTALTLQLRVQANRAISERVVFCFFIFRQDGSVVSRFVSQPTQVELNQGEAICADLDLDRLLLGAGEYILSAEIFEPGEDGTGVGAPIDILSRTFMITIVASDPAEAGIPFQHPHKWTVQRKIEIKENRETNGVSS